MRVAAPNTGLRHLSFGCSKPDMSQMVKPLDDDIWDDDLLIRAYDESVRLAKEQLAKRIAESTNKPNKSILPGESQEPSEIVFKVGDYVRATYDDGVDYEAKILSVDEEQGTCLLKYVGYENEQEVDVHQLIPSWGKKARRLQFMQSKQDPGNFNEGGSKEKKRTKQSQLTGTSFSAVPPPPPMPPMLNDQTEDSEHLSAMLMSWYMSGYYTGLYQGRKMVKNKHKIIKK